MQRVSRAYVVKSPGERLSRNLTIPMSEAELLKLEALATARDRKKTELARRLLVDGIDRETRNGEAK